MLRVASQTYGKSASLKTAHICCEILGFLWGRGRVGMNSAALVQHCTKYDSTKLNYWQITDQDYMRDKES